MEGAIPRLMPICYPTDLDYFVSRNTSKYATFCTWRDVEQIYLVTVQTTSVWPRNEQHAEEEVSTDRIIWMRVNVTLCQEDRDGRGTGAEND